MSTQLITIGVAQMRLRRLLLVGAAIATVCTATYLFSGGQCVVISRGGQRVSKSVRS